MLPLMLIHENVFGFETLLLDDKLGHLYHIAHLRVAPADVNFGFLRRPRLYSVISGFQRGLKSAWLCQPPDIAPAPSSLNLFFRGMAQPTSDPLLFSGLDRGPVKYYEMFII